jgi:hypothetical protein
MPLSDVTGPDALSIHRSFVVRLYPVGDLDAGEISGRVEHIISGEAGEFSSTQELLRLLSRLLRAGGCGS